MVPCQVHVAIKQTNSSADERFIGMLLWLINPRPRISTVRKDAGLSAKIEVIVVRLVSRKDEASKLRTELASRDYAHGFEVCGERRSGLTILEAVVVGERVRADFLEGSPSDTLHQFWREEVLAWQVGAADSRDLGVGTEARVRVSREHARQALAQLPGSLEQDETDDSPGRMNSKFLEKV
jgi:hypothetical protein